MKKTFAVLIKVFVVVILVLVGAYFLYKNNVKKNLEYKVSTLNHNWNELLILQDKKHDFLKTLVNNSSSNIPFVDSLNVNLKEYDDQRKKTQECNASLVYNQYLSNKYMLSLVKFYSENDQFSSDETKKIVGNIQDSVEQLNGVIEKYNSSVRDYNFYYAVFPNFLIARSYGLKKKSYFEIKFGVENIDPKIAKKNRREWQRKIEMEHGVSE